MYATGFPCYPPRPVAECLPLSPALKQVQSDWLGWWFRWYTITTYGPGQLFRRGCYWWVDWCSPPPWSLDHGSPQPPHDNGNQHHSTHMGGAQPKTSTAKPVATILPKPQHRITPNLVEHADYLIQAQMIRKPQHPHWWKKLKALYRDSAGNLSDAQALQLALQQAMAFQLPAAQKRHQDGGETYAAFANCVIRTSYPVLIPQAWGISGLPDRKKSWCWPKPCNAVQRGQGCLPESCAMQHVTFKGVWHP